MDDLFENFSQRFQNNERPVSAYDQVAFPKVRVNEEVQVAGKKCQLRKTDYYYMTFSGKLTNPKKRTECRIYLQRFANSVDFCVL